jgi:hypothetical protein
MEKYVCFYLSTLADDIVVLLVLYQCQKALHRWHVEVVKDVRQGDEQ